jgi:hypothetical protein
MLGWHVEAVVKLREECMVVLPIGEAKAVNISTHPQVLHVVEDVINLPVAGVISIQGGGVVLIDVDEVEPQDGECMEGLGVDITAGLVAAKNDGFWDGCEKGHPGCGGECPTYSGDKNRVTPIVTLVQSTPVELWTSRLSSKSSSTSATSWRRCCWAASRCDMGGEVIASDEGGGGSSAARCGTACVQ